MSSESDFEARPQMAMIQKARMVDDDRAGASIYLDVKTGESTGVAFYEGGASALDLILKARTENGHVIDLRKLHGRACWIEPTGANTYRFCGVVPV